MKKFTDYLTESIEKLFIKPKIAVVYMGGFYPFHKSHEIQYKKIKAAFPNFDIIIATKETQKGRLNLTFDEKKRIISSYDINPKFIKKAKDSFFTLKGIFNTIDSNKYNIAILAYGEKDFNKRPFDIEIKNEKDFFNKFNKNELKRYAYKIPKINKIYDISGTELRQAFKDNNQKLLKKYLSPVAIKIVKIKI